MLPCHHVYENCERLHHADISSWCCPAQIHWQAPDYGPDKSVPLWSLFHARVYKQVASPNGRTQNCCQWVVSIHACQADDPQTSAEFQRSLWLDGALDKRPLGGSEHLLILFDFDVLVEGLGGHWEHDGWGKKGKAAERSGVKTVRGNCDDSIEDT